MNAKLHLMICSTYVLFFYALAVVDAKYFKCDYEDIPNGICGNSHQALVNGHIPVVNQATTADPFKYSIGGGDQASGFTCEKSHSKSAFCCQTSPDDHQTAHVCLAGKLEG